MEMEIMNMNMKMKIVVAMVMTWIVASEAALTCGQVNTALEPCLEYLRSGGNPSLDCCNGVKNLNNAASTTPDRSIARNCLKTAMNSISGINDGFAASLPNKCGVDIPYQISRNTDCSRVV